MIRHCHTDQPSLSTENTRATGPILTTNVKIIFFRNQVVASNDATVRVSITHTYKILMIHTGVT